MGCLSILVVEDDADIRNALTAILTSKGYQVEPVENGKLAIYASYTQFFNLALIDIRLPDMNGVELLGKLKKTKPKTIKIIITGNPSQENAIAALNKGADAYILKPFDPAKLLATIRDLICMHADEEFEI